MHYIDMSAADTPVRLVEDHAEFVELYGDEAEGENAFHSSGHVALVLDGDPGHAIIGTPEELAGFVRKLRRLTERPAPRRRPGVLPKGAGAVRCSVCHASAAADGTGRPIVLRHADDCPGRAPR
jgi:LSD1 subclass zinc finger protein